MSDASDAFDEAKKRIEQARVKGADKLNLSDLEHLKALPEEISGLTDLISLNLGDFSGKTQVADITPLQNLSALQILTLYNTQVADITPLQNLSALQRLDLDNTQVADITPLQNLSALQRLDLNDTQVSDITPLQNLSALQHLTLNNTQVADITPLQNLSALQHLTLNNTQVADITPLQNLSALHNLYLNDTQVADITPLQNLSALQILELDNTQVVDITPLQNLSALQSLDLDNTRISDLRLLLDLPQFRTDESGGFGLWFRNIPATEMSEELNELSKIEGSEERHKKTRYYLRSLPPYPEPLPWEEVVPNLPDADSVPRIVVTNGKLDVAHLPPDASDIDDPIKERMYERLRNAVTDLVRLGNQYPEVNSPAAALNDILSRPFEETDLLDIHIEVASLTDLIAANSARHLAEQIDVDCLGVIRKVARFGPPLTLGNPDVELFEARNLQYAQQQRDAAVAEGERLIAQGLIDSALLTDRASHFAEIVAAAPDEGRIAGYRVSYVKNMLLKGIAALSGTTALALYHTEAISALEFISANRDAILTVASSWMENGEVWAADLVARSSEVLAGQRRRPKKD